MAIKVGDYDVLENGSIICMIGYPIVFTFGGISFKVILHRDLATNKNGETIEFSLDKENPKTAEVHLYIEDSVALASEKPYTIGVYNERLLLFAFSIESLSLMSKSNMPISLNYMWLQKDKDNDLLTPTNKEQNE